MYHKDPSYPLWLVLRQALLDTVPEILHHQMAVPCSQVATLVIEVMRTKLGLGDTVAQAARIAELQADLVQHPPKHPEDE